MNAQISATTDLNNYIMDGLGLPPGTRLLEITNGPCIFKEIAQKRNIIYTHSTAYDPACSETDWIILPHANNINWNIIKTLRKKKKKLALIIPYPSFLQYFSLRMKSGPGETLRIKPANKSKSTYMASTGFFETLRRTYQNADLDVTGKCLVALKVALTPSNAWPVVILIR